MNVTSIPHLDGDPGVAQTVGQMCRLVKAGKKHPSVHELAAKILRVAHVPAFNWEGEARAVFGSTCRNLRFTRDVYGHETLHSADEIIRLQIGDCDDFTILICALMGTIGAECRIVTIATDHPDLGPSGSIHFEAPEFCHVFPQVNLGGRWVSMDAARKNPAFGKSPEHFTRMRVWDVETGEFTDMAGFRTNVAPGQGPQGAWSPKVYPPFRMAARVMTGTYLKEFPVAPPHQQFKRPPLGLGNYGVPAAQRALADFSCGDMRRTLGQGDGFDWSALITAGTTGAANIISAERASPYNLVPTTAVGQRTLPPSSIATSMLPQVGIAGISTTTLLLGGGLILALVLAERRD